jgi:serine/threonine protein kinase
MLCNRRFTRNQALEEVAHLDKIRHSHVIRVIGTYILGKELSILLYPVAEYNLDGFLEAINTVSASRTDWIAMRRSCKTFFACLASAMNCIHNNITKHMDIKPQNLLVRDIRHKRDTQYCVDSGFKVYIADFGIARSYDGAAAAETDGRTSFTPRYAAPEVVDQATRGLSADIFSLGCVFIEIFLTITVSDGAGHGWTSSKFDFTSEETRASAGRPSLLDKLRKMLATNACHDESYQANIAGVIDFFHLHLPTIIMDPPSLLHMIVAAGVRIIDARIMLQMIDLDPKKRPTAGQLEEAFAWSLPCCKPEPEELEAMHGDRVH